MQNKGLIKLFAILFGVVSIFQLSYTYFANKVEREALDFAHTKVKDNNGRELAKFERKYLDSVANKEVAFGSTYNDIRNKEMNLGLDLKGGINAILQVSVKDILIGLSNKSENKAFNQALAKADEAQKNSQDNYLDLFYTEFEKVAGGVKLSDPKIFRNKLLREKVALNDDNVKVKAVLQQEINSSIQTSFDVLRSRIDKFGVVQPKIQRIGNSGRIQIELPGAKDIERVTKLITSTAELEFWEVYTNAELVPFLIAAQEKSVELLKSSSEKLELKKDIVSENVVKKDSLVKAEIKKDSTTTSVDELLGDTTPSQNPEIKKDSTSVDELLGDKKDTKIQKGLFTYLIPNQSQASPVIGYARVQDTAMVNSLLRNSQIYSLLPNNTRYAKFLWDYKSFSSKQTEDQKAKGETNPEMIKLYAMKSNRSDEPTIEGDVIADARQDFDQGTINQNKPVVSMTMNSVGTKKWAKMTTENNGKFVAVVLDNNVYTAPVVTNPIITGSTQISGGSMTINEAKDIATVLKAGKLPAPARIIQAEVVGPSLGKEAISTSMLSFGLAILLVLVWMVVYYGKAGMYANIALLVNILFIFGALASFGSVLTLPGIAGIILTIGMSVDANVIVFERIKEALDRGVSLTDSVDEGFSIKGALSAILDANITTFLTGVILYAFGSGPIRGFALTLMIGILTSLFTAILITRLLVDGTVSKGGALPFNTGLSKNWFKNLNFDFLSKRKVAYIISGTIIVAGIVSMFTLGLKQGVDFKGGRSYVVRFENPMNTNEVSTQLGKVFKSTPEVKTYGSSNQLKITTAERIDEKTEGIDAIVEKALYDGLKSYLPNTSYESFKPGFDKGESANGIMSYMKVEPTIADDIKQAAIWAVLGSLLVVFLYILLRFRKMSYSIGAVVAVFHDVLIVLAVFSICYRWMPFDMEIGESFIAAILTVVGYSLNDTVVIFDRIREFTEESNSITAKIVNKALNTTMGRTINTSLTTMLVMMAIFFFGGDSIKGFMFALIVGVVVGTYSSLFVATPIMFDVSKKGKISEEE